jgi:flavodoxin
MRRIFKIIIAAVAVIVIVAAAFGALIFLDLAAYTATGSQTLTPTVTPMGTALVLYDPGLTGASTQIADQIAADLLAKNMTVTLAGIKSSTASNTTGYDIIIIGGPTYAGAPAASVKDALSNLQHDSDARVGVYCSGQGSTTPQDIAQIKDAVPALQSSGALSNAVVVKIGESEDLKARAQDFVNQVYS